MIYLRLFFEFFKAGLFAVGGGLATLPFLYDMSSSTGWFSHADIANMIAVSESTPGPIGVNMATYAGFTAAGILGSIVATVGLITPSCIIILIISSFLNKYRSSSLVNNVFGGLRPAAVAMIAAAFVSVLTASIIKLDLFAQTGNFLSVFDIKGIILAVIIFFAIKKIKLHPIVFIAISAVVGIVFKFN